MNATALVSLHDNDGLIWTGKIVDFFADNSDAIDDDAQAEILAALDARGECTVGDVVAFTLRRHEAA